MNYRVAAAVGVALSLSMSTAGAADPPAGAAGASDKPAQAGDAKAGKAADKNAVPAKKSDAAVPAATAAAPAAQSAVDPDLAGASARNRPASQATVTTGTRGKPKAAADSAADKPAEAAPAPAK